MMTIRKFIIRAVVLFPLILSFASPAFSTSPFGQTLQINTRLSQIIGRPSWLLIVRDEESGRILPYLFDFNTEQNFWIAFTAARFYRITVSNLKFSPVEAINNFCQLEGNVIDGRSMMITLTGLLSPDVRTSSCYVSSYQDAAFSIAH